MIGLICFFQSAIIHTLSVNQVPFKLRFVMDRQAVVLPLVNQGSPHLHVDGQNG